MGIRLDYAAAGPLIFPHFRTRDRIEDDSQQNHPDGEPDSLAE